MAGTHLIHAVEARRGRVMTHLRRQPVGCHPAPFIILLEGPLGLNNDRLH